MPGCKGLDRYGGDEAIAPPVDGFNHTLGTTIITHSLTGFRNTIGERCVADEWLGP
jgi:hypothetical protein